MSRLRVQFIHGLEGSPSGSKASLLARHFESRTPAMDTGDFEGCVARQAETIRDFHEARAALQRAVSGQPSVDDVIANKGTAHPFGAHA